MKIEDLMNDARPGSVLIRHPQWEPSEWFAPYFNYDDYPRGLMWAGLDQEGIRADYPNAGDSWELWELRKQPVVRWKWAYLNEAPSSWIEVEGFYTDDEVGAVLGNCLQKKKLDYTRTEFPS